jgi:hypothetical protein
MADTQRHRGGRNGGSKRKGEGRGGGRHASSRARLPPRHASEYFVLRVAEGAEKNVEELLRSKLPQGCIFVGTGPGTVYAYGHYKGVDATKSLEGLRTELERLGNECRQHSLTLLSKDDADFRHLPPISNASVCKEDCNAAAEERMCSLSTCLVQIPRRCVIHVFPASSCLLLVIYVSQHDLISSRFSRKSPCSLFICCTVKTYVEGLSNPLEKEQRFQDLWTFRAYLQLAKSAVTELVHEENPLQSPHLFIAINYTGIPLLPFQTRKRTPLATLAEKCGEKMQLVCARLASFFLHHVSRCCLPVGL